MVRLKSLGSPWHINLVIILNSLRPGDAYVRRYSSHHWLWQWFVTWSVPSHYLSQCLNIVNWNIRNKLRGNFNRNSNIFIRENALVVCEMASILSRPQWIKGVRDICVPIYDLMPIRMGTCQLSVILEWCYNSTGLCLLWIVEAQFRSRYNLGNKHDSMAIAFHISYDILLC